MKSASGEMRRERSVAEAAAGGVGRAGVVGAVGMWLGVVMVLLMGPGAAWGQGCEARWSSRFPRFDVYGTVRAQVVFDDGSGPALYVAGQFGEAGGVHAESVAKWDGTRWRPLGAGLYEYVYALAVFDDGTGPALYAGGNFGHSGPAVLSNLAKWNGSTWVSVGQGVNSYVRALAVFNDGSGPALHVGGAFTSAGGVTAKGIAKWDGSHWSEPAGGLTSSNAIAYALAVFDDGSGRALYVAGSFVQAGMVQAANIARWDGAHWSALGLGVRGGYSVATCMQALDDDTGSALVVGGLFNTAGEVAASNIARWQNGAWSVVGPGLDDLVSALVAFDDGSGAALYAGGAFSAIGGGGPAARSLARFREGQWSPVGGGTSGVVRSLMPWRFGGSRVLMVGGQFDEVSGAQALGICAWDGQRLAPLGDGPGNFISALLPFDDGSGPALYAAGEFRGIGDQPINGIARWNGRRWEGLTAGRNNRAFNLAVVDDGDGPSLYAFVQFARLGTFDVVRWVEGDWQPLGHPSDLVRGPLVEYGPVGRRRLHGVRGLPYDVHVAVVRWEPAIGQWAVLGDASLGFHNAVIWDLKEYDSGGGPYLCAAGSFDSVDGVPASGLAVWNGARWGAVGGPLMIDGYIGRVYAMAVFDEPSGRHLFVGGLFNSAAGAPALGIARWDGQSWSGVGGGVGPYGEVQALAVFDDGTGPALYAAGYFTHAGGVPARGIAKWDGVEWSALGAGLDTSLYEYDFVNAMVGFDDGNGPSLWVGGSFGEAGDLPARYIAQWVGCPQHCRVDWNNDGVLDSADFLGFLSDYLAGHADFNHDGMMNSQDFFDFLTAYFAGCP